MTEIFDFWDALWHPGWAAWDGLWLFQPDVIDRALAGEWASTAETPGRGGNWRLAVSTRPPITDGQ